MQYKKQDTKNKILLSAIDEFYKFGDDASIRRIAESAGVAVGNIYNYFGSKSDLYEAIILPVAKEIENLFNMLNDSELTIKTVDIMADKFIPYMVENKKAIRLLMNAKTEEGDKKKESYFDLAAIKIKSEIDKFNVVNGKEPIQFEFARAIGKAFLYGVFDILFASSDSEKVHNLLDHFFVFYFKNLNKRV
ncbi:MAG: TetR/AcrR family transcriptional regulator [Clostridia bacterium]